MNQHADNTRAHAPKCRHGFHCSASGSFDEKRVCCRVASSIGKEMLFVVLPDSGTTDCGYRLSFGGGHICSCPVHAAKYPGKTPADIGG